MTYGKKLEQLHDKSAEKSTILLNLQKKLEAASGFSDITDVPEYIEAYQDTQFALNQYNKFFSYMKLMNIEAEREYLYE